MINLLIFQGGFANQLYQLQHLRSLNISRDQIRLIDATDFKPLGTVRKLSPFISEKTQSYCFIRHKMQVMCLIYLSMLLRKFTGSAETYNFGFFKLHFGYFQDIDIDLINREELKRDILKQQYSDNDVGMCAIHIRLGDYLLNNNDISHGVLPISYYTNAIQHFVTRGAKRFIIVTDSPDLIDSYLDTFQEIFPSISFQHMGSSDVEHDFTLMLKSEYFIGANSSLSAWASYLRSENTTILPKSWSADGSVPTPTLPNGIHRL